MKNPADFVAEVRAEGAKVVWPSRREAALTSAMVLAMTAIVAAFFFLVDQILSVAVGVLLGL